MAKKLKEKKEEEIVVPTMFELIKKYKEGSLPSDQLVFKYQSSNGEGLVHRDELHRESVISGIYSSMHQDKLIGARTRPDDGMTGVDKTNWEKTRKL